MVRPFFRRWIAYLFDIVIFVVLLGILDQEFFLVIRPYFFGLVYIFFPISCNSRVYLLVKTIFIPISTSFQACSLVIYI